MPTKKVNLLAPINQLGYGVVGLNILRSVSAKADTALFPIGAGDVDDGDRAMVDAAIKRASAYDPSAPSLRIWHQNDLAHHVGRGPRVGFPFFEVDPLSRPDVHQANALDHYLVASEWARGVAERSGVTVPVSVVPLGVDRSIFKPMATDRDLGNDQTTVFFNVGKWEIRKGHDVLLSAFNKAFEPSDDVMLRMACHNPFLGPQGNHEWNRLYMTSKMGRAGKIQILPHRLKTQADVAYFMSYGDVGVFPSRAEGWNLDLLEAMSCGKSVIATDYSAHTEFCDEMNSTLIPTDGMEDAVDGVWFHGEAEWARLSEAAEDALVEAMRSAHRVSQMIGRPFNEDGVATAERFSWEAAADRLLNVLA